MNPHFVIYLAYNFYPNKIMPETVKLLFLNFQAG